MISVSRTIEELVTGGHLEMSDGYRTKRSEHGRPGFRIVRVADIHDGTIDLNGSDFVSEGFERAVGSKAGRKGDILLTTKGTVGRVAVVPELNEQIVYSPQVCYFRVVHESEINRGFLKYWFSSAEFLSQASNRMNNTDMAAYINLADIRSLIVSLPSDGEQRAIAEVLGALDDKITANTALISTMSELMPLQFPAIVGTGLAKCLLSSLATTVMGVSYRSADLMPSSTALVTLKSFDRRGGYVTRGLKPYVGPYKPQQKLDPGEIAVAKTDLTQDAEVVGRAVRVAPSDEFDTLVASLDLAIVRPVNGVPSEFLLGLMLQPSFREHCKERTSGTTVLHLASDAIQSYRAPDVSPEAQMRYAHCVRPILALRDATERESRVLAETRDTLLPALMSGKLRVKDAEKRLEEVL